MTWLEKLGVSIVIALILVVFGFYGGMSHVQKQWDLEKARMQGIADQEKIRDALAKKAAKEQAKKDIENAKTEAYRKFVRDYLSGRVLSNGATLRDKDNRSETDSSKRTDEKSCECGVSAQIEEFAIGCGIDAASVLNWQEWATREGLPVD